MIIFQLRLAGYGLLSIGAINFLFRGALASDMLRSVVGRLSIANGLIAVVPWLLLPLLLGYLLLVPLMIRDAIGFDRTVQSDIAGRLQLYRNGTRQLGDQVAPLSNGEARLVTRLDDQRRSRLEGLFERTIASTLVALVAAAGLAGLRRQNLAALRVSGHKVSDSFGQDLINDQPASMGFGSSFDPGSAENPAYPKEWIVDEQNERPIPSQARR